MAREMSPRKVRQTNATLKKQFDAAHVKGMKALQRHDYDAVGAVIADEASILQAHHELIADHVKTAERLVRDSGRTIKAASNTTAKRKQTTKPTKAKKAKPGPKKAKRKRKR